jgi:hypothetical protein
VFQTIVFRLFHKIATLAVINAVFDDVLAFEEVE